MSFPSDLHGRLVGFLTGTDPLENGCYLTADWHASAKGQRMLVRTAILPGRGSWNAQSEGSLDPSSAYLNHAVGEADDAGACLLFIHTHPSSDHPPEFSSIDEATNGRFFRDVPPMLDGRPVGSIVMSRAGMHAVVHHGGEDHAVRRIDVVGGTLERADRAMPERPAGGGPPAAYARQEAMLGPGVQGRIRNLDVCVVGVGGVGSSVAAQLARLGAGRIRLVDPDVLEESNIHRLYGSEPRHVGTPKVDVVREHLESFSSSDVRAVRGDICDDGHLDAALDADVTICCTDSMKSRDRLNEASLRYYRPLIDVGCNVVTKGRFESTVYAQAVTPSTACLWCTGQINAMMLADECLPEGQRRAKADLGYYEPHQPATITLTTWAACLGMDKLFSLLGLYGGGHGSASYVDITSEFCHHRTPAIKDGCVCKKLRFA